MRMKNRRLTAFLVAGCLVAGTVLTACSKDYGKEETNGQETEAVQETEASAESAQEEQEAVGEKWLNSDILGVVTKDTRVSEKDDFAAAVNQEWLSQAKIPDGYSFYGAASECEQLLKDRKLALIGNQSIQNHNEDLVTQLYEMATDWESRNAVGISAAKPYIETIQNIGSVEELTEYLSSADKNLNPYVLAAVSMGTMAQDSSRYLVEIGQMDYLYPYPDDYQKLSAYGEQVDKADRQIAIYVLRKFGWTEEEAEAVYESCIDFEGSVTKYAYTEDELSSPELVQMIRNECTWEEVEKQQGSFPMTRILTAHGYDGSDVYNVVDPELFQHIGDFYNEDNLDRIKNYLLVHTAILLGTRMDQETYEAYLDIHNQAFGIEGKVSVEEYGYNCVSKYLPYVIDYLYLDQWCTKQMQEDALQLVEDFKDVYKEMLLNEDWLSEETKQKAVEKLEAVEAMAVYPEKQYDYSKLDLSDCDTYLDMLCRIEKFEEDREKEKINGQVDKAYWEMESSVCNAYYDPTKNIVVILAGIMLPPLYSEDMGKEEKLAGLGETIGHELSHAFDTFGAQYDKEGNLVSWWTDQDYQVFQERAQSVVQYLNRITPDNGSGEAVNGTRVQGEMIADLGGTKAALLIAAREADFDYDKFFRMHALQWRMLTSKEMQQMLMATDAHPLQYLRINVVLQQFQEFYDTYDIKPGDGMYLAPEKRIEVW